MSELTELEQTGTVTYCSRGCTKRDRHHPQCEDVDECRGCLPKRASNGLLCYDCHHLLENWLTILPEQYAELLDRKRQERVQSPTEPTIAKISDGWRTDNDQAHQGPYARGFVPAGVETEPYRLAVEDALLKLGDVLSERVEHLMEDYRMRGPERLETSHQINGGKRKRWHPSLVEPASDPDTGAYLWEDAPPLFEVPSASRWLLAQIERLEYQEDSGDFWGELGDAMSQAHCLAPIRPAAHRLPAIPCPECHAFALLIYGMDENVTCERCKASIPPGRYGVWTRELVARHQAESAEATA